MKIFINDDFLLSNGTAKTLYFQYASKLPVIDYHCHLSPRQIAEDINFKNMTEIWLQGDHYKWRALRANGINENHITGNASDWEKFYSWAQTVPYTLRNPLYHWTHLELKNPFGINELLNGNTAKKIWDRCNTLLQRPDFSTRSLIKKANVEVICTTDDPTDSLKWHKIIKDSGFTTKVLPTWRADKVLAIDNLYDFNAYLNTLSEVSGIAISSYKTLIKALKKRQDFFEQMGCKLSDHGLDRFYCDSYTEAEINTILKKAMNEEVLTDTEKAKYKSAILYDLAIMDHEKGWTQQFHIGVIRNNNTKMFHQIGPDTGFDSIGDDLIAKDMATFFNRLASNDKLSKTILYNLNPSHNEVYATMIGNFQDGSIAGKIQWGSGWWFLDQKDGMEKQMNALSNLGLLSRFVGMLTDSRSFLSYSRHEYFRRILCNLIGQDVEKGLIPNDMKLLSEYVENICYYNASNYFNF
ncbi:MAG: glucuronate isomerase [Bacteroidales bacterium]|nr:glucuronate isomerase [Bacteroidales bacterium]